MPPNIDSAPDYSPDGSEIAFESDRSGATEIWIAKRDGSGARRVTNDPPKAPCSHCLSHIRHGTGEIELQRESHEVRLDIDAKEFPSYRPTDVILYPSLSLRSAGSLPPMFRRPLRAARFLERQPTNSTSAVAWTPKPATCRMAFKISPSSPSPPICWHLSMPYE